jgi:hypothetical protein
VCTGKQGEQGGKTDNDQEQAGLRGTEDSSKHRVRPVSVVANPRISDPDRALEGPDDCRSSLPLADSSQPAVQGTGHKSNQLNG